MSRLQASLSRQRRIIPGTLWKATNVLLFWVIGQSCSCPSQWMQWEGRDSCLLNIQYVSSGSGKYPRTHVTCYVTVGAKYTACNYWPVERKHRLQRRLSVVVKAHSYSNTPVVCARTLLSPASLIQVNVPVSPLQLPIMQLSTPVPAESQHLGGFLFFMSRYLLFSTPSCLSLLFTLQRSSAASRSKPRS